MADNEYPPPPNQPPPWPPQQPPWPPPPGGNYAPWPPQAPPVNATLILVFGILGIVLALSCTIGGIFGTVAWIMGNAALATLDQTGDPLGQRGMVTAGRVCGMIATGLMALMILLILVFFAYGMATSQQHP